MSFENVHKSLFQIKIVDFSELNKISLEIRLLVQFLKIKKEPVHIIINNFY